MGSPREARWHAKRGAGPVSCESRGERARQEAATDAADGDDGDWVPVIGCRKARALQRRELGCAGGRESCGWFCVERGRGEGRSVNELRDLGRGSISRRAAGGRPCCNSPHLSLAARDASSSATMSAARAARRGRVFLGGLHNPQDKGSRKSSGLSPPSSPRESASIARARALVGRGEALVGGGEALSEFPACRREVPRSRRASGRSNIERPLSPPERPPSLVGVPNYLQRRRSLRTAQRKRGHSPSRNDGAVLSNKLRDEHRHPYSKVRDARPFNAAGVVRRVTLNQGAPSGSNAADASTRRLRESHGDGARSRHSFACSSSRLGRQRRRRHGTEADGAGKTPGGFASTHDGVCDGDGQSSVWK